MNTFSDPYARPAAPAPVQNVPVQNAPVQSAPVQSAPVIDKNAFDKMPAQNTAPVRDVQPVNQAAPMQNTAPVQNAPFTDPYKPAPYSPSPYKPADFGSNKEKRSGKKWALSVAAVCAALVISGGSFYAGATYNGSAQTGTTTSATSSAVPATGTMNVTTDTTVVSGTVTDVVDHAMPSMVAINTITEESMGFNPFYYYMYGGQYGDTYESKASGSGIIIAQNDSELLIVTNNHVIEDADQIAVQFIDNESYDATIKGTAAENDLAVIAVKLSDISADTLDQIKVATLGNSDNLKLGEPAIAIGNSLGYGQSVTVGYISAVDREVQISDRTMSLIQTDAAINPGNSGGALLNVKGEVIGINSAKYSDTSVEGTGYAIPISFAEPIINELMNGTSVTADDQPYLGIYGQDVPASYRERFDWPEGVYVSGVTDGSPAKLAGIESGDIIVSINGQETGSMDALQEVLGGCKVGDTVSVTVMRSTSNGDLKKVELNAKLISRADANIDE